MGNEMHSRGNLAAKLFAHVNFAAIVPIRKETRPHSAMFSTRIVVLMVRYYGVLPRNKRSITYNLLIGWWGWGDRDIFSATVQFPGSLGRFSRKIVNVIFRTTVTRNGGG